MTYSIVFSDPETQVAGVAVCSGSIAVGSRVPWARFGAGAVATQAYTNPALGPIVLELLGKGLRAKEALTKALERDPGRQYRQLAVASWSGDTACFTGKLVPAEHGGYVYRMCVAIANLVVSSSIPREMCRVFLEVLGEEHDHVLALLEALKAGHEAGGDRRGDTSAALLVVGKTSTLPYYDKLIDVRVDFSSNPLADLTRIIESLRAQV